MSSACWKIFFFVLSVLPLAIGAIVGVWFSFSPEISPRLIGAFVCVVWAAAIVSMAVKAAWTARWRRCLGLIAILLIVLPMSGALALWAGDYVHLAVMWPSYRSTIQAEPGGSRVAFEWETVELMFGQIERTLVYDPSDSAARENDTYDNYYGYFTRHRHLIGHFYLIENSPWKGCVVRKAYACQRSLASSPTAQRFSAISVLRRPVFRDVSANGMVRPCYYTASGNRAPIVRHSKQ